MKSLLLIVSLISLFFFYHSQTLSANNPEFSKKWQDLELKKLTQPKNVFAKEIDQVLPEPQASLLNGMIFGLKSSMPEDFFKALKRTGVLHIIALSGTNISILINAVFGILVPLINRKKACLLAIFLIIIFIWFVGPSASVVRAGIMGIISLLAGYFGRQYHGVLSLFAAVFLMIIISPKIIGEIGFQLSVMATIGIMVWQVKSAKLKVPSHQSIFKSIRASLINGMINNLKVTLSAQVFTLPILIANFGQLSIISPLTNILIAPVIPMITTAGLLAAILVILIKPVGVILLWSLWVLLSYFVIVVKLTSLIPLASINVPKIGWGIGAIYYLVVLWLILRKTVKIII